MGTLLHLHMWGLFMDLYMFYSVAGTEICEPRCVNLVAFHFIVGTILFCQSLQYMPFPTDLFFCKLPRAACPGTACGKGFTICIPYFG